MVLLTGCIDAEEAFSFIDVRLLALILAMLAIGAALEHSGAVTMVWFCPAYVPVSQLIYAALRSKAKGLFPPSDECRRLGL